MSRPVPRLCLLGLAFALLPSCIGLGVGFVPRDRAAWVDVGDTNPQTGEKAGVGRTWTRHESWTDLGGSMGVAFGIQGGPTWVNVPGKGAMLGDNREFSLDLKVGPVLGSLGMEWSGAAVEPDVSRLAYTAWLARLGVWQPFDPDVPLFWHVAASYRFGGGICTAPTDCWDRVDVDGVGLDAGLNLAIPLEDLPVSPMLRLGGMLTTTLPGSPLAYSAASLRFGLVGLF